MKKRKIVIKPEFRTRLVDETYYMAFKIPGVNKYLCCVKDLATGNGYHLETLPENGSFAIYAEEFDAQMFGPILRASVSVSNIVVRGLTEARDKQPDSFSVYGLEAFDRGFPASELIANKIKSRALPELYPGGVMGRLLFGRRFGGVQ